MRDTVFVCLMGIGTVFVGLICIIIVCNIVSGIIRIFEKKPAEKEKVAPTTAAANEPIPNRQCLIAAVSAAVAEELGTDVSAIKILSFKKL
mgnify:CR=1 FL=1